VYEEWKDRKKVSTEEEVVRVWRCGGRRMMGGTE
jgi:hypothetical protein